MIPSAIDMQIKSVVMRDIKAIGAARAVSISKDTGKSYFIDPAVASASARLVHRVFESCSQVCPEDMANHERQP